MRKNSKEIVAQKLQQLMADHPLLTTQEAIAQKAKIGQTTVGRILRAEVNASADKIKAIADAFGVAVGFLYGEETAGGMPLELEQYRLPDTDDDDGDGIVIDSERRQKERRQKGDVVEIPQYKDVAGSMGGGLILRDQPGEIQEWRVTPEWVNKNIKNHTGIQNLRIVTGFGDSMKPLYNPGDPLICDTGIKSVEWESVYFFRIGNEGFIKRLQRIPGKGLLVISENQSYRDWYITEEMDFEVFGQILKAWHSTDF